MCAHVPITVSKLASSTACVLTHTLLCPLPLLLLLHGIVRRAFELLGRTLELRRTLVLPLTLELRCRTLELCHVPERPRQVPKRLRVERLKV
jgi:hypothetical protein